MSTNTSPDASTYPRTSSSRKTLRVAYTPDSDDAFNFYAWEHGRLRLEGFDVSFDRNHIIALNEAAKQERYDVVSISSVMYPSLADRYWILSAGNSIGRGYGPVLVSKHYSRIDQLSGRTVAVAGIPTTGAALAAMYCDGATFVEMPYNQIADAIVAGQVDAGVMIHEELLFFPEKGLQKVCDLGLMWCTETQTPLPVGLNVCGRRLDRSAAGRIDRMCRESLRWARDHFDEAFAFASQFGRGCSQNHVDMFSNDDTLRMAEDVRRALSVLFERVHDLGWGPRLGQVEVIDG